MTDQKNGPTPPDRKGEGAASPKPIVVDLSISDIKKALWDLWSPQLVDKDARFIGERLASVMAENAWLKKNYDIAVNKLSENQKLLLDITEEQKRLHKLYQKQINDLLKQIIDLSDRLAAAGL